MQNEASTPVSHSEDKDVRLPGLRRFAIAITVLNILGHTLFGFEQSWAHPLVALATGYSMEIALELADAWQAGRQPYFARGGRSLVDFLLSAHISAMAVSMLLYANDRLFPIMFGTAVAIGSKAVFKVMTPKGPRHFFNPSNLGITITLLLFPWIGIAPPYMFTENLHGIGGWILPGIIVLSGSFLNYTITKRIPMILAWLGGFAAQAFLRHLLFGHPLTAALLPMTGMAFLLYTFYMVTDPGTTPSRPRDQVAFGLAVAATYGMLMMAHIVFGLFFSLTIVCTARGILMAALAWYRSRIGHSFWKPVRLERLAPPRPNSGEPMPNAFTSTVD